MHHRGVVRHHSRNLPSLSIGHLNPQLSYAFFSADKMAVIPHFLSAWMVNYKLMYTLHCRMYVSECECICTSPQVSYAFSSADEMALVSAVASLHVQLVSRTAKKVGGCGWW